MNISELGQHCWDLSYCLEAYAQHKFGAATDWLNIAAGIVRVEFDSLRFDENIGWCSTADEYLDKKQAAMSPFVAELSRFIFIWCALEASVEHLWPEDRYATNQFDALYAYLRRDYAPSAPPPEYCAVLDRLRNCVTDDSRFSALIPEFQAKDAGPYGTGLQVVRKIRNRLPAGPEPEEWGGVEHLDHDIVTACSRLVLLSLQMLVSACEKNNPETVGVQQDDSEAQVSVGQFFRFLHISDARHKGEEWLHLLKDTEEPTSLPPVN